MRALPHAADTVIVGGGTTGAALAGLLAERSDESIVVLEAGPDFGALEGGGWPADVLDATWLATSHQLGYASDDGYRGRRIEFARAGMIGGCSSHNGCAAIWGSALDYDALAEAGGTGWSRAELEPLLRQASERMRVRIPDESELAPFHRAALASLVALGVPRVRDLNDLDADTGVAPSPVNIADGVRWNSRAGLPRSACAGVRRCEICGMAPAERLLVAGGTRARRGRAAGRRAPRDRGRARGRLCAGAYDSPALLLRSGIGPAADLRALGIPVVADLPGRRREPPRPPRSRAPLRRHARAGRGLPRPCGERRLRADRGRDREAALGSSAPPRASICTSIPSAASCPAASSSGSRSPA